MRSIVSPLDGFASPFGPQRGFNPLRLFSNDEDGVWYDTSDISTLFQDNAGTTPVTTTGQTVGRVNDKSGNGNHATQPTAAAQPEYLATPDRLDLDQVDDNMSIDFGAEFIGTVLQGTPNGVIHYDIDVSDGAWNLTVDPSYVPDGGGITGMIAREGSLTSAEVANVKTYLQKKGAGDDFAGVTDMAIWFRERTDITAIYSGDWNTSSVTRFSGFAREASSLTTLDVSNWDTSSATDFFRFARNASSLTTLDVSNWDTSSVTDFGGFAQNASSLTTVTVNGGTGNPFADSPCTDYTLAFLNTNLTQQSIDDILVAIELAGTSNGTFDQSGGSAPSSTGEAAITALRGRGWTVTVTGGF
jgi:surface protein